MPAPSELQRRLEVQGFTGLTIDAKDTVAPWVRFTPALNIVLVGIGTALASAWILAAAATLMVLGVLLPGHPWDFVYNVALRPFTHTKPLPSSNWRRRLTFAIGAPWLAATAWTFRAGHATAGFVLGGVMVALMLPLATVHWCIVSEIVDRIAGTNGRGSCSLAAGSS